MTMHSLLKNLLVVLIFITSARLFAPEPGPRTFKITNQTNTSAQIYLTAKGWAQIGKGSGGNLAYSNQGVLDPEGQYRLIAPGQSTTYQWDDMRMGFCIGAIMVQFSGESSFNKARTNIVDFPNTDETTDKDRNKKNNSGCPNQDIYLTRDNDGPVATFNYTQPEDPIDLPEPTKSAPDPNQPAPLPLPTSVNPTKEEIKAGMNGPKT